MRPPSFRTRILFVVVGVAVVPLALVGLWLTRSAVRSGEDLLRARLANARDQTVDAVVSGWITYRSQLLFLAENPSIQVALQNPDHDAAPPELASLTAGLGPGVAAVVVSDEARRERWRLERPAGPGTALDAGFPTPLLTVTFQIHQRASGRVVGTLDAELRADALLPAGGIPSAAGMVVALFDTEGVILTPTPVDPSFLENASFSWGGDEWLTAGRTLVDPPVTIVVATPLTPFAAPFQRTARRGLMVLFAVAVAAVGAAVLVTGRLTRSLRTLSQAAHAVSHGELGRRVRVEGDHEVGRVAEAFNAMTDSLERTLDRLASRESLAAVGQFAASLAHEVRNPLTAIRLDLQRVEEALPPDFALKAEHERALSEIGRLNETVSVALARARSGRPDVGRVDIRQPLRAAVHAAAPTLEARGVELNQAVGDQPLWVEGDAGALEQLFLNLIRNAAEAADGGTVTIATSEVGDSLVIEISDTGPGIAPELMGRVFEALFTTRPEGTGLGLTIARRIARAHAGDLRLANLDGHGLTAEVRFPKAPSDETGAGSLSRNEGSL